MSQLRDQSKSWRKRAGSLVLIVIGIYLIIVLSKGLWDVVRAGDRVKVAQRKVDEFKAEQAKLQRQLALVQSDAFTEQQIRDELMLAQPGETVVVVPFDLGQGKPAEGVVQNKEENLANWQKWAKVFGF